MIWQKTFYFKDLITIFLGLPTAALFSKEARFFSDLGYFSGHVLPETKSVTSHCFCIFGKGKSSAFCIASLNQICTWEHFGRERP